MIFILPLTLHALPSRSSWAPFGTGSSMVLWWSSFVSAIPTEPDLLVYTFVHKKMCTATTSPGTVSTSSC
jgi:hypothetical protein